MLKLPAIALGAFIVFMLHHQIRHALTCAYIYLALYVGSGAFAVGYIGMTSTLYPGWKVNCYAAILLISLASLFTLIQGRTATFSHNKKKPNKA